jgi:hypothetical protein
MAGGTHIAQCREASGTRARRSRLPERRNAVVKLTYSLPVLVAGAFLCLSGSALAANPSASGTLAVTATVASSIQLVFNSSPSGVTLSGSGTNAAALAFGTVQAYGGAVPTGATRTVNGTTSYTYSSPFYVNVSLANSSSASYTLTAALNAADTQGNTWAVDSVTLSTSAQTITASGTYSSNQSHTLALTIPFSAASGEAISNTVNFTATAN